MWNADRYPLAVTRQHVQAVIAKRDAMGYEWLLPGIQLSTLTFRSQTGPPTYSARGQRSASGSPALSTHLFGWFKHAKVSHEAQQQSLSHAELTHVLLRSESSTTAVQSAVNHSRTEKELRTCLASTSSTIDASRSISATLRHRRPVHCASMR